MVMTDPAIFQVIVLFAGAHYATYGEPKHYETMYTEILKLKQTALQGLMAGLQATASNNTNAAGLRRPARPDSDPKEECLIAAITKMASFEAIYGEPAAVRFLTSFSQLLPNSQPSATHGISRSSL
jgi:hypothetical protein